MPLGRAPQLKRISILSCFLAKLAIVHVLLIEHHRVGKLIVCYGVVEYKVEHVLQKEGCIVLLEIQALRRAGAAGRRPGRGQQGVQT